MTSTPPPRSAVAETFDPPYTVLQIPTAPLDHFVSRQLAQWAPDFLRVDAGIHAHVTVLAPFLPESELSAEVIADLRMLIGAIPAFDAVCQRLGCFPDGLVYAAPAPASRFSQVTDVVRRRWPHLLPYGFATTPVPHISLDYLPDADPPNPARASLSHDQIAEQIDWADEVALPVAFSVRAIELVRYSPGDTRALHTFHLR